MEIEIKLSRQEPEFSRFTGGGYAIQTMQIFIDDTLPYKEQREILIHEIIESLLFTTDHDKIDIISTTLDDAIDKLDELKGGVQ